MGCVSSVSLKTMAMKSSVFGEQQDRLTPTTEFISNKQNQVATEEILQSNGTFESVKIPRSNGEVQQECDLVLDLGGHVLEEGIVNENKGNSQPSKTSAKISALLGACRVVINDIVKNYDNHTYLNNVTFQTCLKTLTEYSFMFEMASVDEDVESRKTIGYDIITSGCFKILCAVIMDAIKLGWVDNEEGKIDKVMVRIVKNSLCVLNNFIDANQDLAESVCGVEDFLRCLVVKLQSLFQLMEDDIPKVNKTEGVFFESALNLLYNCAQNPANKTSLRVVPLSSLLISVVLSKRQGIHNRVMAVLCLASIQREDDCKRLQADPEGIAYLVTHLDEAVSDASLRSHGWSTQELARGVANLAKNDANKKLLVAQGVLPVLHRMSQLTVIDEQKAAVRGLWSISFDDDSKSKIISESGLIDRLLELRASTDVEVKREANRTLWNLRDKLKASEKYGGLANSLIQTTKHRRSHVMISYNWDNQDVLLRVREYLRASDYRTWMDVDNMEGSTLQAMAEAVENSAAVVVCMSEKYKDSQFCRLEFEYAFKCNKPLVPLLMQENYIPDGWLGLVVGNLLYHDFTDCVSFDKKMDGVIRALGMRGKSEDARSDEHTFNENDKITPIIENLHVRSYPRTSRLSGTITPATRPGKVASWTNSDVLDWLKYNELIQYSLLRRLSGPQLVFLFKIKQDAPETFYHFLKSDFKLRNLSSVMEFTEALEKLFQEDK